MEILFTKKDTSEGVIKVTLHEADYQPRVEETLKDYARKAQIKGFRPGKVPAGMVRQMFGKSIKVEEVNKLLSQKVMDYIRENNLRILGEPLPDLDLANTIDWENQATFEMDYRIGLVDSFTYELSDKVKVTSYDIQPDDKTIEETIADIQRRYGNAQDVETISAGDSVFGKLTRPDGSLVREYAVLRTDILTPAQFKPFEGATKDSVIEFAIREVLSSDKDIANLLMVEEHEAANIDGTYVLTVTTATRTTPAELNQELFDKVFAPGTVSDEAGFRAKISETISENYNRETGHFLDHMIEDQFLKATSIALPEGFLRDWIKVSNDKEITDEVMDREFGAFKRQLTWDLIKSRIEEDNQLKVEEAEVRGKAKMMILEQFGANPALVEQLGDRLDAIADNYLKDDKGQNFSKVFNQVRHEKVLAFIKSKITLVPEKISVDGFKQVIEHHRH